MSFFRRNKERIIVILIAIILITIIGVTSKEGRKSNKVENYLGKAMSPINSGISRFTNGIKSKFTGFTQIFQLKEENENLKKKIATLESENRKYENIIGKNEYLKKHYKLLDETKYSLIEAEVTGKGPGNWYDTLTINKGKNSGIKVGDIVIQAVNGEKGLVTEGLVGQVVKVGDNWANVVTIIDEHSRISFKTLRSQDGGVLYGSTDNKITGSYFDNKADVKKGDKIVTSGLGGVFPEDLYIGKIKEVISEEEEMEKRIEVDPAVDFKKIYTVYILSN